ncbi:hypothetical protein [Variovorax sp. RCC_210]|uniref:hypothetical protein n=1 Tax=Variovorax sp. RCC_210 TaxID=3239217 RepID=UPI00352514D3
MLKEFAGIFERYPEFGFDIRRLLAGERHWTLTFRPPSKERRGFHALHVVEVNSAELVTARTRSSTTHKSKPPC